MTLVEEFFHLKNLKTSFCNTIQTYNKQPDASESPHHTLPPLLTACAPGAGVVFWDKVRRTAIGCW